MRQEHMWVTVFDRFIKSRGRTFTVPAVEIRGALCAYEMWAEGRDDVPQELFRAQTEAIAARIAPLSDEDPHRTERLLVVLRSVLGERRRDSERLSTPPVMAQQENDTR